MFTQRLCRNHLAPRTLLFSRYIVSTSSRHKIVTVKSLPHSQAERRTRKQASLNTASHWKPRPVLDEFSTEKQQPADLPLRVASHTKISKVNSARSLPHSVNSQLSKNKTLRMNPDAKRDAKSDRDAKVSPSKGSGGVPNPTLEYLNACKYTPLTLAYPQHLLVVIDLNGTLLYRPSKKAPKRFLTRPHAHRFLKYCVDTFTVVIWSSARSENVAHMCNSILTPDIQNKVAAIWGRETFGLTKQDYNLRVQCYKRLSKIWMDQAISKTHPAYHEGFRWDQTNTVLIDDSREKARTEPFNLIEVPEWFGDLGETDDIFPQVHDYLNHLSMHSDVSACLHAQSFVPIRGSRIRPGTG